MYSVARVHLRQLILVLRYMTKTDETTIVIMQKMKNHCCGKIVRAFHTMILRIKSITNNKKTPLYGPDKETDRQTNVVSIRDNL